jgi:hypothetical protein
MAMRNNLGDFLLRPGGQSGSSGSVAALSLIAIITDINDVTMYANAGGIQLTARLYGNAFTWLPRKDLLSTDAHYEKALRLALDPLMKTEQGPATTQVKVKGQ